MSLPLKIKGKRVAKARNIELLEVPLNPNPEVEVNETWVTIC